MGVKIHFLCDGCEAQTDSELLSAPFVSLLGRGHGIGSRAIPKITDATPEDWIAFDPYTGCCYCPACWESITHGDEIAGEA